MEVMGTSGNIPDRVSETERTIEAAASCSIGRGETAVLLGTMIKLKHPWNDQPENASQSKVTHLGSSRASPDSGPSPP
jgi:exosome complex RNA-binding protein Rrp42 (RNase PH superfamily)